MSGTPVTLPSAEVAWTPKMNARLKVEKTWPYLFSRGIWNDPTSFLLEDSLDPHKPVYRVSYNQQIQKFTWKSKLKKRSPEGEATYPLITEENYCLYRHTYVRRFTEITEWLLVPKSDASRFNNTFGMEAQR